ncbi:unnamed protein product [Paramecium pentaurelia]|uniref:Sidoreflexin n=1 Tax=Paramecium pentaurelia TaxID=43138 RepID=A0A8S1VUU2_9CILI|nr:unnamed protein product [Paramecium pentaurelia]
MKRYTNKEDSAEDLTTYWGRLKHFQNIISPANIFYSSEQLNEYGKILENVDKDPSIRKQYTDQQLWKMRYVVDSNIHPQLKEPVNILFRTSTFVPVNVPLAFGLAVLPPTPINQLLAQSANQTYNFMFNYCNRNASNVFSNEMLAFSYGGAVSSAVVGSLGTSWLFKKLNAPALLIRACPLFGVLIANTFNLFFARYPDFQKGIQVFDDETQEPLPGLSKEAAKIAFFRTLVTRYILPLPMFIPPIVIYFMKQAKCYPQGRGIGLALDLSLSGFFLYCGLSVGIGIFPQYLKVNPTDLESQYQNLTNSKGNKIKTIVFNKGL